MNNIKCTQPSKEVLDRLHAQNFPVYAKAPEPEQSNTYRVMQFIDYQGWQWCDDFDAITKEECEKSIKLLSLEYPEEQFMLVNIEEIRENTNRYLGKELEKFLPKGLK